MATGVKPRDEEHQITRSDLEAIQDAMKSKKFRDLLAEYCEEVRDPANQALYQEEMTKLEKERGYDVTFINPKGSYVIKTSVAGDRKAFINICSNEKVNKPSCSIQELDGQRGMNWQLPYSIIPPREDFDRKKERCVIYDVVFHPDTLRMAEVNKRFRELVNKTAMEGLSKTYNIHFDSNNFRFPKSHYKGMAVPAVLRKEDPDYKPYTPTDEESEEFSPELVEKLYPQHIYPEKSEEPPEASTSQPQKQANSRRSKPEFMHSSDQGYTIPKYLIKQQKSIDLQDYTYHKDSKQYTAIPSHIVVEINLPLLSSTKDCNLDVKEKSLSLVSEKPAKYKLSVTLPYPVNEQCGNAKFDKTKRKLIVTLPVIRNTSDDGSSKVDSGVESEENSGSQSDEEHQDNLVIEISSTPSQAPIVKPAEVNCKPREETFLDSSLSYIFPSYTHNVMDDIVAFTFHVKNTEPDSVIVKSESNKVHIKFTSVGSGFVPVHYAAVIIFEEHVKFENASGEAWDNNVILQLEISSVVPQNFKIGLNEDSVFSEYFDVSQLNKANKSEVTKQDKVIKEESVPLVEVTNLGSETNIVVSSNYEELDEDDLESPTSEERDIVWTESNNNMNGAKSILRKPMLIKRSYSESSAGDVASSVDYISSDCIPEESSLKKTVRFNDVIAKQFYRYNSSIEGQKKKNQRKKSKKRNLERRKSESEAEDEVSNSLNVMKPRLKSALKPRRDSGLADTSDAETDVKNTPTDSPLNDSVFDYEKHEDDNPNDNFNEDNKFKSVLNIDYRKKEPSEPTIWESTSEAKKDEKPATVTCDNIKHKTDLYNPDRLNKGQYQEVMFKNDLIFDLDM